MNSFQPVGLETTLGSATDVDNASYVTLLNTHTAEVQIIVQNANVNPIHVASFTMEINERVCIAKAPGYELKAAANGGSVLVTKCQKIS